MGNPEVRIGARENNNFDVGLIDERVDEGEEVVGEFLVINIYGGVVDAGPENAAIYGGGYGAVACR